MPAEGTVQEKQTAPPPATEDAGPEEIEVTFPTNPIIDPALQAV